MSLHMGRGALAAEEAAHLRNHSHDLIEGQLIDWYRVRWEIGKRMVTTVLTARK